jgi:phage terminase small subunit
LNLVGTWKSPGGDIKHFTNEATDISLKWLGTSKKRLNIVKEDNYTVTDALSKLLNDKMAKKSAEKISINAKIANVNENCNSCNSRDAEISSFKEEITRMDNLIVEMAKKQQESEFKTQKNIADLTRNNNKMANEIDTLKMLFSKCQVKMIK